MNVPMMNKEETCITYLAYYRAIWPGDMFGMNVDDDLSTLLNVYCIGMAEKKTGTSDTV